VSENLLSLWDEAIETPPYPTYTLLKDESGELLATALKDAAERMRPARSVA